AVNGGALPGTSCDDGNTSTENDMWDTNCVCSGTPVTCTTDAGADLAVCGPLATLQGDTVGTGIWSGATELAFSDINDPNASVTSAAFGAFEITWTVNTGNCIATDVVTVNFINPEIGLSVDAGPDQDLDVVNFSQLGGSATHGAITNWWLLSGGGNVIAPSDLNSNVVDLALGDNYFILTASLGQCSSVSDTVMIHVDDLFIPEGYSPNGDQVNDKWEITGMAAFPNSNVKIFSRWGQLVYDSDNYQNQWDGSSNNGHPLPDDTYFYVLNLSGDRAYNGAVIIKR
ncbi:MAG TPA: gliding motility-associated C-terminal domain-containing protein, partial [Flavobacteriales bacterium]|nr:gliding motility-associated C-terminal domain-containing protein [Flavobacteriales bacterium]